MSFGWHSPLRGHRTARLFCRDKLNIMERCTPPGHPSEPIIFACHIHHRALCHDRRFERQQQLEIYYSKLAENRWVITRFYSIVSVYPHYPKNLNICTVLYGTPSSPPSTRER